MSATRAVGSSSAPSMEGREAGGLFQGVVEGGEDGAVVSAGELAERGPAGEAVGVFELVEQVAR